MVWCCYLNFRKNKEGRDVIVTPREQRLTVFRDLIVSPRADPFFDVRRTAFSAADSQQFLDEARQRLSDCVELR